MRYLKISFVIVTVLATFIGLIVDIPELLDTDDKKPTQQNTSYTNVTNDPLFSKYDLSSPKEFLMLVYDIGLYKRQDLWKHMITQEQIYKGKKKYGDDYINEHYKVWTTGIMSILDKNFDGDIDRANIRFINKQKNKGTIIIEETPVSIAVRLYNGRFFIAEN